jgi:hypothetical protein
MRQVDVIGAVVAHMIYIVCILIFCARLVNKPRVEHWLGLVLMLALIPLAYLLVMTGTYARPPLYYVQVSLMIVFLIVELLLDYVFEIKFRQVRWMAIAYVMLFFGATGGMLGVAATAGPTWSYSAVGLFLIMTVLAFVQRAKTGM